MKRSGPWLSLLLFAYLLGWASPLRAQEGGQSASFTRLWVAEDAQLSADDLFAALAALKAQTAQPDQIVLLVHGYEMGPEESGQLYGGLADEVRRQMADQSVAVVGLQWASIGGSLLNPTGNYFGRLSVARNIGRGPLRELLIALKVRYPGVPITIMAHSMGCEIALAAIAPEIAYAEHQPTAPTYQPDWEITIPMAVFVAPDLDYDIWYQAGAAATKWFERCGLTWMTVTDPLDRADRVLSMRARIRGKAAGALFPRMTVEQLDRIIPERRLFIDGHEVPSNHAIDAYLDPRRLGRILNTLRFLTGGPTELPEELAALRSVLAAPNTVEGLAPYLDSPYDGAAFYALWRLERLLDGDARHLSDQTMEKVVLLLADSPQAVWREQAASECQVLHRGLFPTDQMMLRAGAPPRARPEKWKLDP